MIRTLSDNTVHRREVRVALDKDSVESAIAIAARQSIGLDSYPAGDVVKVEITEQTEGSPPYKVGYKAVVTFVRNFDVVEAAK